VVEEGKGEGGKREKGEGEKKERKTMGKRKGEMWEADEERGEKKLYVRRGKNGKRRRN